eukprot:3944969-Amphidinium_carterae.1
MFTAKSCVTSPGLVARSMGVVRVLAFVSILAAASASDFLDTCHEVSATSGEVLMQMVAKTGSSASPPLQLSGIVGGLQAEYFYFNQALKT